MLQLHNLYLENFCQHNGIFHFKPGINVLLGANGSGKSNLLAAIHFALLGKVPNRTKQSLVQFGKDHFKVRLDFSCRGTLYAVERTSTGDATLVRVVPAGVSKGAQIVNQELANLGFTENLLKRIFILQGDLDQFLLSSPANRIKYLMDLVPDLPLFEKIWKQIGAITDKIKIYALPKAPDPARVAACRQKIRKIDAALTKLQERIVVLKTALESSLSQSEYEAYQAELSRLQSTIQSNKEKLSQIKEQLQQIDHRQLELIAPYGSSDNLKRQLQQESHKLLQLIQTKRWVAQEIARILDAFTKRPKLEHDIRLRLKDLDKQFYSSLTSLKLASQAEAQQRCPICGSRDFDVAQLHTRIALLKAHLARLQQDRAVIEEQLSNANLRKEAIQYRHRLKQRIHEVRSKQRELTEIESLQELVHRFQDANDQLENLEKQKAALLATQAALEAATEQAEYALSALQSLHGRQVISSEQKQSLQEQLQYCLERQRYLQDRLSHFNGRLSSAEAAIKQRKRVLAINRYRRIWSDRLASLRAQFHRSVLPSQILNRITEYWIAHSNDLLAQLEAQFSIERITDDKTLLIRGKDGVTFSDHYLSGGQRVLLSLVLHLAEIAFLGGETSTIIIDEPTVYLDEDHRHGFVELLKKIKAHTNLHSQMILTTHDAILQDAADHLVRI